MTVNGRGVRKGATVSVAVQSPRSAQACLGERGALSVIMPSYNLGPVIFENCHRVYSIFNGIVPFEIILVDDGSTDETAAEIRRASASLPNVVKPVFLSHNAGKGAALSHGFAATSGTHILLLDADLDLNPALTWGFFSVMQEQAADIVIGSKMHPNSIIDYPWHRRLASWVYYGIVKLLVGLPVHDTQTGMKLFRREALEYALSRMLAKRFAFDLEVLSIANEKGYKTVEAPVELDFRGKAGCLSLQTIKQVMTDTLAIFYRLRVLKYYRTLEPRPMPDVLPRVSVVIACPDASPCLDECLAGLARQQWPDMEILVLPDMATGRVWPSGVREIPTGKVRPAEKRNRGIAEATGTWIAFVDDDACPLDGWLAHAAPYFDDRRVGAVGGPSITPSTDSFLSKMGARVYENIFVSGPYRRRYTPTRVCDEDDLPSCNLIVRTDLLRELGGFDVRYWPGEDTILCMGIVHTLGKRMIYDPRVVVSHHRRPLFGPHLRQISRYARHRGFFSRRFPQTSFRLAYMLPSLFVIGVVGGFPLAFVHPLLRFFYVGVLAVYLGLTALSSVSVRRPHVWLLTWAGVVSTHLAYGVAFLLGLCSRGMAIDVRPFDHHSEKTCEK